MARRAKIFYSLSKSIFENLAFEEWLFRNHCIDRFGDAILFWSNKPTVVIGRHQNPWLELDIAFVKQRRIDIVRRHSGGGAVYHDLGQLTSFLFILLVVLLHISIVPYGRLEIQVVPNTRDDLLLQPGERKISGTAARIAHSRAYHHMTLLVDTDLAVLKKSLKSPLVDKIRTNATASVRASAVGFLTQDDRSVTTQGVIATLTDALERHYEETEVLVVPDVVNEQQFPGVRENERLLRSWEWTFGKSPKFTIRLSDNIFHVEKGIVQKVEGTKVDTIGSQLPAIIEEL
ncbi:unnamed protein product [Toxocara canis]|uniref:BPL/LPL catalytic domain-containing protein n=1 Tax=Toxocara canis TaxID=6265 RepID=A0A183U1Y9_TOXCA|nr:unnamed protein product [Toxocara canis]